jgi:hypothetical protein
MTDRIRVGTMLLEDSTGMPESVVLDIEPYSIGWSLIVKATAAQLGKDLEGGRDSRERLRLKGPI